MFPTNTATSSTWMHVGDFMLRSDGVTVEPVQVDGKIVWSVVHNNGMPLTVGGCPQAYSSADAAMVVAEALTHCH